MTSGGLGATGAACLRVPPSHDHSALSEHFAWTGPTMLCRHPRRSVPPQTAHCIGGGYEGRAAAVNAAPVSSYAAIGSGTVTVRSSAKRFPAAVRSLNRTWM